jgi:hypothetical protein
VYTSSGKVNQAPIDRTVDIDLTGRLLLLQQVSIARGLPVASENDPPTQKTQGYLAFPPLDTLSFPASQAENAGSIPVARSNVASIR